MKTNIDIQGLLEKPIWQMTGEEYCQLTHYALSLSPNSFTLRLPLCHKEGKNTSVILNRCDRNTCGV